MGRSRKSRNTAKTGDKALYSSRPPKRHEEEEEEDEMRLSDGDDERSVDDSEEENERKHLDDGISHVEGVFDLGLGGGESSDEEESSSDEEGEAGRFDSRAKKPVAASSSSSSSDESDSDSSDDEEDGAGGDKKKNKNILDWGASKNSYYHGDTADLEIGQDEDDAYLEEEAGQEVQRARLNDMDEGDFLLDEDDDEEEEEKDTAGVRKKAATKTKKTKKVAEFDHAAASADLDQSTNLNRAKRLQKLSKADKLRLLQSHHPELLPLITHFRDGTVVDLLQSTHVVGKALLNDEEGAKAVGATPSGLQYLLTKSMLQTSTALNVCLYLLLKSEHAANSGTNNDGGGTVGDAAMMSSIGDDVNGDDGIQSHPVIARLNALNGLADKLSANVEDKIPNLREQMESLVKAAALMDEEAAGDVEVDKDEIEEEESTTSSTEESAIGAIEKAQPSATKGGRTEIDAEAASSSASSSDSDESEDDEDEDAIQRRVVTEARFALRPQDDLRETDGTDATRMRRKRRPAPFAPDFGDDDDNEDEGGAAAAGRRLATTVNAISQRSESSKRRKGTSGGGDGGDDDDEVDEDRFQRGLAMMEADLGVGSSDEEGEGGEDEEDHELDDGLDDDDDDDLYERMKAKSKAKKEFKKGLYAVAPKYPSIEGEVEGERAIGRMILKNRGLVAHKSKLNRNPRVKKREQYRKALIRRKGAVREVRTDEGHKYGGEGTGIKSGLSRSRKLGVR